MFTSQTVLSNSDKLKLGLRQTPLKDVVNYEQVFYDLSYANNMRLYWIEHFLDLERSDKFLDIGCGYGNIPIFFNSKYDLKLSVGIDLDQNYVNISRNKSNKLNLANVSFKCASAYKIPFEDGFRNPGL